MGPEQLRPPVLKPDRKSWVVYPPVARIYRADPALQFRHAVGSFHPHPHTDLAHLLRIHTYSFPLLSKREEPGGAFCRRGKSSVPARSDRYSKVSGAASA